MAAVDIKIPIFYTHDVHGFYRKRKNEFHFQKKSDNEFLMFLLDAADRVISVVQHLAPVIEAVSSSSGEISELKETGQLVIANSDNNTVVKDVDAPPPTSVSTELQQIGLELTKALLSDQLQQHHQTHQPQPQTPKPQNPEVHKQPVASHPVMRRVAQPEPPSHPTQPTTHQIVPSVPKPPNVFTPPFPLWDPQSLMTKQMVRLPVPTTASASSINLLTSQTSVIQPVAELPDRRIKEHVPEVINIKEEVVSEAVSYGPFNSNLLTEEAIKQVMASMSRDHETVGLNVSVTTASSFDFPPPSPIINSSTTEPLPDGTSNHAERSGSKPAVDSVGPSVSNPAIDSAGPTDSNPSSSTDISLDLPGNNVHKCKYKNCGTKTSTLEDLYEHIRTQHPLKKYRCDVCPMSFISRASCFRHKNIHTGEVKFPCSICGVGFNRRCVLKRHMDSIHPVSGEVNMFFCPYCKSRNARKYRLMKHIVRVHPERVEDSKTVNLLKALIKLKPPEKSNSP